MQGPPDISTNLYDAFGVKDQRLSVLLELYDPDELPGANGFDPANALLTVADSSITFLGRNYPRYIKNSNTVNKSITERLNNVNITLDNSDRSMATFILTNDIEGMFMVIRFVSRSFTASSNSDSLVVFTGKCQPVFDADYESLQISATQYIGSTEEEVPWRLFTPEDELGTAADDVLFEGFLYRAFPHIVTYKERVRRTGFLGLLGFKKTVIRSLPYTSHQGTEIEKSVPLLLGRTQLQLVPVAYIDVGDRVNAVFCATEGPIKTFGFGRVITSGFNFSYVADSNPNLLQFRYGYDGNTNGQVPFVDSFIGGIPANGYYSRSAMVAAAFFGTDVAQDDPAPDVIFMALGMLMDLPDDGGEFNNFDWSDNPAFQTRWALTKNRMFNLDPAFINDPVCLETACYCDEPVLDVTNGEIIVLPESLRSLYGNAFDLNGFNRYHSTGLFTPEYFKHYFLGIAQDPLPELQIPTEASGLVIFYDPTAPPPTIDPKPLVRKRFTSNIYLSDKMKSIDFLFKVLLPSYRGYLLQNANGKIDIRCKRPADNTIVRSAITAGDDEIAVNSITPWVISLAGEVLVGNGLLTSECRAVTSFRYTPEGNSITLAVSGNLSTSGATFSGGDSVNPATATITVTGLGVLTVTIDGRDISYTTITADTVETAAAMLTQFLRADETFKTYIRFVWDKNDPTNITCYSRMGFLTLSSPLEEDHDIAEEIIRVQMSFSDRLSTPADLQGSNILKGSMKWPVSQRYSSVNRIDGSFIDSPQDFKTQQIRTRDQTHIARTKKTTPEEITLTAVDNYNQAKRLEGNQLAERRDLNFFVQHSADRRALLLEEGDIICNTHASGGFRNLALRIEEVQIDLKGRTVNLLARRYSTNAYSDDAAARNVPLPTTLGSSAPPAINFDTAVVPPNGLEQTTTSLGITSIYGAVLFGASSIGQVGHVYMRGPTDASFTLIDTIYPDSTFRSNFEVVASIEGVYTFQLETCFTSGSHACNATRPEANITIVFGVLGGLLTEAGGDILTQGGDYLSIQF